MCPWTRAPPAKTARWEATATSSGETHNPDNLRPAVSRAHRHEPDINPTSEAPNGWIKEGLGFQRLTLRGLAKVCGEWGLVCLALNIKRMGTLATC